MRKRRRMVRECRPRDEAEREIMTYCMRLAIFVAAFPVVAGASSSPADAKGSLDRLRQAAPGDRNRGDVGDIERHIERYDEPTVRHPFVDLESGDGEEGGDFSGREVPVVVSGWTRSSKPRRPRSASNGTARIRLLASLRIRPGLRPRDRIAAFSPDSSKPCRASRSSGAGRLPSWRLVVASHGMCSFVVTVRSVAVARIAAVASIAVIGYCSRAYFGWKSRLLYAA